MRNSLKKRGTAILAVVFAMFMVMPTATAFASGDQGYLALGADLSGEEKSTVLELLGVADEEDYNVITVTNAEEHQYLDTFISSSEIGTRALSSILITENGGSDINVETQNINYCTTGMYKNALVTAGVQGADVKVAGPFEISGTAALVGAVKAYEQMTGETVSDEVLEGSLDELTTTGEIGEAIGDKETAEAIIAKVKEEMANNPDMTDSELEEAVREAANEAGINLSNESIDKIVKMLSNLQELDIDWDNVKQQSQSILENFKDLFQSEEAQGFISRLIAWFKSLF
ncbi:MAG: DUF1002 domain-containing protein [Firmicutes bacterium]|nr:DUF1002 domain-containing protein [Bacillota bacterium]